MVHELACWAKDGAIGDYKVLAPGCSLHNVHVGFGLAITLFALLYTIIGATMIHREDHRNGDAVACVVVVSTLLAALSASALYLVILLTANTWPLIPSAVCLLLVLTAIAYGERFVYLGHVVSACKRIRNTLSITAALERKQAKVRAELAAGEQQLLLQRQELEADPYGRYGLEAVERLTAEPA